ncbi:hypothetical protein HID58_065270 [Brassica napus]|uniref:Uncharacterized protein n=1 Tax=Brassica napus TaxID=3708 RepID=A0ABQ7ZCB2_BRANA|nr:hypothetical protein HID58_065270 [Brassica napus]
MVRLIFYALFVMFSVQLTTSAVTHLTVTASSSCFAFAVETLLWICSAQRWPNRSACLPVAISPPAALLNLFSQPEQANTKRGYASLPCRILCTSFRSPTQTHTLCLMFAVSVPSQGPIPRSPSHHNSYITVSLASFAHLPPRRRIYCARVWFRQIYSILCQSCVSITLHHHTIPSSQASTVLRRLAPPLPYVLIPTNRRNTPKSSARRLDRTEALYLLPGVCLNTLIQNECDDIRLRSIPVTNYWLRDGNVEGRGFDPIKPFSLSSNSIVLSVLMKAKLAFEIHTVSLRSFVEFKTDCVNFSANSSQIGLLLLAHELLTKRSCRATVQPLFIGVSTSISTINCSHEQAFWIKVKLLHEVLHLDELDSHLIGFIFLCFVLLFTFVVLSSMLSYASIVNFQAL